MNKVKKGIFFVFSFAALLVLFLITNSCSNELDVLFPEWSYSPPTTPLNDDQRSRMEGIYTVEQGSDQFGSTVILQWTTKQKNYLSVYTGKNFGYMVLQGGNLGDTTVYVQGFWRYQSNAQTGLTQLQMIQGTDYVLNGTGNSEITFTGTWGKGQGNGANRVVFKYQRPIKQELLDNKYYRISHHGSGGGPEYLPQT